MRHVIRFTLFLAFGLAAASALADAPLPPPSVVSVCSADQAFCAISDPAANMTAVRAGRNGSTLWQIPGWHRYLYLSHSGESLVVEFDGGNLLPADASPQSAMLQFYVKGNLVRTVLLREWFPDPSHIQKTVSHLYWGDVEGFTEK